MPNKNIHKHAKKLSPQQPNSNNSNKPSDSIAGSMLREVAEQLGLDGLFDGKIVHVSFDCPYNLREAFKHEIISNGSSQCKELQKFMLSYIVVSRLKKHALGNTLSKLVDMPMVIENLSLNQYVQSRPRRYVRRVRDESSDLDDVEFVNEFGVWCVLKQSRFRSVKLLPCFYWKSCRCGNVNCWSRVQKLLRGVEVGEP